MNGKDKKPNILVELLEYLAAGFMLWLSAHPEKIDEAQERLARKVKKLRHSVSIGEAIRAIRKLPETEEAEVTETKASTEADE